MASRPFTQFLVKMVTLPTEVYDRQKWLLFQSLYAAERELYLMEVEEVPMPFLNYRITNEIELPLQGKQNLPNVLSAVKYY